MTRIFKYLRKIVKSVKNLKAYRLLVGTLKIIPHPPDILASLPCKMNAISYLN